MTDKVKLIKSEIERLIGDLGEQRDVLLEELIDFINSLPEKPVIEDLEEAANKYAYDYTTNDEGNGGDDWEDDIATAFKDGAQWQKQQTVDKACEWLFGNWSHYVTVDNGIVKCYNNMIDDLREYISEPCR